MERPCWRIWTVSPPAPASGTCKPRAAKPPKVRTDRVVPWTFEQVQDQRAHLPRQYAILIDLAAGCGLRQGEILALGADDVDYDKAMIRIRRQLKIVRNRLVFAEPKGRNSREVPLPGYVAAELKRYTAEFSPVSVALPWVVPTGKLVSVDLVVYGRTK